MNNLMKIAHCSALVCFLSCAMPNPAGAFRRVCENTKIIVVSEESNQLESVCAAVHKGLAFLSSIGLEYSGVLTIALVKKMPANGHESAIGQYYSRSSEIRLLDYQMVSGAFERIPPAFGIPMNPEIWHSYIVHELAHAAAEKYFATGVPKNTASEYIASVAMLATIHPVEKEKIILNYPELSGFEKNGEITFGYYLLDPSRFSVNAYLHFTKPENGRDYINEVLREGLPDD